MGDFSLSKASLVRLVDALYPNPDDAGDPNNPWGPYGPIGPISRYAGRSWTWVLLNPQPLPPVAGPHPDPWRSAFLARSVIDQVVAIYRAAELPSGHENAERGFEAARMSIAEFIDEYCGNRPPRWPRPWPQPFEFDPAKLDPLDLLIAGAQFHKAATVVADSRLQGEFSEAADRLFETGLQRLQNG